MSESLLDIVDEEDNIIGQALRSEVHAKGLRHREINVWFITPNNQVIFQKRFSKSSPYPLPMLDATAGGHVELGTSYLNTALTEIEEETGLFLNKDDLHLFKKVKIDEAFPLLSKINNVFRLIYFYHFLGDIKDLKIEEGRGEGFVAVSVSDLLNGADNLQKEFAVIPYLLGSEMVEFYQGIADGRYAA